MIITGMAYVAKEGKNAPVGMLGIDDDDKISDLRNLVDHVHKLDTKIAMQIAHCGRQTTKTAIGTDPLAPSAVRDMTTFSMPRAMTEADIERTIESFANAARRVKQAGFDAVQVHGAHGYLISAFLCPYTNRRKDRWGGSLENRMRLVSEVYRRVRAEVGNDYPILIKINGQDNMKNGLRIEEAVEMARMMDEMGFDGIEVSCGIAEDGMSVLRGDFPAEVIAEDLGMFDNKPVMKFMVKHLAGLFVRPQPHIPAYNLDNARKIKQVVKIPVFVVGGMEDPATMQAVIKDGDADYISLCRSLIRNPAFPRNIQNGKRESSKCIHCNMCLFYSTVEPLRCYNGKRIERSAIKKT